ncbi:uncharacterized protein N7459_009839 [Penicillium hispanicum]|uniref:uncharacterized protein n=1 Tax=Penicillium hispanicum TaxID=1080232 RepID=UPI0025406D74|nr:uncharacterized protein N7459_009839 [Penicillium hispanicum]KAJ5570409.1 hypothetical protein N7459_009839 [Penicillium hispanicum]
MSSTSDSSTKPISHDVVLKDSQGFHRDSTDPNMIHHLYFEDNDSFFPPSWLGRDTLPSERRSSNDSTAHHDVKNEEQGTAARPDHCH